MNAMPRILLLENRSLSGVVIGEVSGKVFQSNLVVSMGHLVKFAVGQGEFSLYTSCGIRLHHNYSTPSL